MVTKTEVKAYLHIPYNDEDTLIEGLIIAGYNYLEDAIDDFSELMDSNEKFASKVDLWVKTQWMPCMYDNREGMTSGEEKLNYVARSMLTQLQLTKYEEVE